MRGMATRKPPPPLHEDSWLTTAKRPARYGWRDPSGREWQAAITWGTIRGRAEPVEVTISSPRRDHPVTAAAVRAYPLAEAIRSGRLTASRFLGSVAGDTALSPAERQAASRRRDQFAARRGVALSPEGLEAVAEVYKAAYIDGDGVTKAVAKAFGIAPSTAGKRIMAARRAGLLDGIGDVR
jgi:hypothetical protein